MSRPRHRGNQSSGPGASPQGRQTSAGAPTGSSRGLAEMPPPARTTQTIVNLGWHARLLDGKRLPAGWRRDDAWRGGHGHRLDMPLDGPGADEKTFGLALVDQLTGWALVHEHERRVGP